ncbi:unnamed protein product [Paramecium octaurelia]|uniref:Uncharacterized protein n=1 Tax=Paramecium octaurelia TaxID=43137 RepID=A0A8S1X9S4_PAROT|nr:unnamed protein product [Paramecium octaurelia]
MRLHLFDLQNDIEQIHIELTIYQVDGFSTNLQKCYKKSLNYINSSFYCKSCEQKRYLDQNPCLCNSCYFDDGSSNCSKCDSNCYKFNYNSTQCTECDPNSLKILNTHTNTCQCQPGTTQINKSITCSNVVTNCTFCSLIKLLIDSQYKCIDGTYL